jgi:hypothetical protein
MALRLHFDQKFSVFKHRMHYHCKFSRDGHRSSLEPNPFPKLQTQST